MEKATRAREDDKLPPVPVALRCPDRIPECRGYQSTPRLHQKESYRPGQMSRRLWIVRVTLPVTIPQRQCLLIRDCCHNHLPYPRAPLHPSTTWQYSLQAQCLERRIVSLPTDSVHQLQSMISLGNARSPKRSTLSTSKVTARSRRCEGDREPHRMARMLRRRSV